MNDEAESSRAGRRRSSLASYHAELDSDNALMESDAEEHSAVQQQRKKERRLDAKRKRVVFLDQLLRELDTLVFLELVALYYLEYSCSTSPTC